MLKAAFADQTIRNQNSQILPSTSLNRYEKVRVSGLPWPNQGQASACINPAHYNCEKNDALTEYTLRILQICGVFMTTMIFVNNPYLRMHLGTS